MFKNPEYNFGIPKRLCFRGAQDERTQRRPEAAQQSSENSREQLEQRLQQLDAELSAAETREDLEALKSGVELQQQAQEQEQAQVNELLALAELDGGLDSPSERAEFMNTVNQELTKTMALLLMDQEITIVQISATNIEQTIAQIQSSKDQIRIKTSNSERNFYEHEKGLLNIFSLLKNHQNQEVRSDWNQILSQLQTNVSRMVSATDIVRGENPKENVGEDDGIMGMIQEKWDKVPNKWKKIALVAAAAGIGIFLLNKIFSGDENGNESNKGSIGKLLGIGALLAGGVYLYGRLMKVDEAWDKIKGTVEGLSESQFMEGLAHFKAGRINEARRSWGNHASELMQQLDVENENKSEEESSLETDEYGVEYSDAGEAFKNYKDELSIALSPVFSFVYRHRYALLAAGLTTGTLGVFNPLTKGVQLTKEGFLGLTRFFSSQVRKHPLISTMLIVSFAIKANGKVPKDGENLKKYLQTRSSAFADYLRQHNYSSEEVQSTIDLTAGIIDGTADFSQLGESVSELTESALNSVSETLRISQFERVKTSNKEGMGGFLGALAMTREDHPERREYIQRVREVNEQVKNMGTIRPDNVRVLISEGRELGIKIEVKDGYIWYGEATQSGEYINPEDLRCIGIDPGMDTPRSIEDQSVSAERFSYNPNFSNDLLATTLIDVPIRQLSEAPAQVIDRFLNGQGKFIIVDGALLFFDGVQSKYINLPLEMLEQVMNLVVPGREFSSKELLFTTGEGIVPVMMLGATAQVLSGRNPFSTLGLKSLLAETALYPVKGPRDLFKRIGRPFARGARAGANNGKNALWSGVQEVARFNGQRVTELFEGLGVSARFRLGQLFRTVEMNSIIDKNRLLRKALQEVKVAENAMTLKGKEDHLKEARRILGDTGGLYDEAKLINNNDLEGSMERLRRSIALQEQLEKVIISQSGGLVRECMTNIQNGLEITGDQIKFMKYMASNADSADDFIVLLKSVGIPDGELNAVRAAFAHQNVAEIAEVLGRAGFIQEGIDTVTLTANESGGVFRRALDALESGREMGADSLNALKRAFSNVPESAMYKTASQKLGQLRGMTTEMKESIIRAFKEADTIGSFKRLLGSAGGQFIRMKEGVSDSMRIGGEITQEMMGRLTASMSRLLNRIPLSVDDVALFRQALSLRGSRAYNYVKESLSVFDRNVIHTTRHFSVRLEQILMSDLPAPQLKSSLNAVGIQMAEEVSGVANGTEALARSRGMTEVLEKINLRTHLGANDLAALLEASKQDGFIDSLRQAGVTAEQADEITNVLRSEKNLSRLQDALEATDVIKFGDEVKGMGRIFKALGPIAILAGAGFNAFDAYSRYQMAEVFKENPEAYAYLRAQGHTAAAAAFFELTIDLGTMTATAQTFGRAGQLAEAAFALGGRTATLGSIMGSLGPQIVIMAGIESLKYMVTGAFEARAEVARESEDWKNVALRNAYSVSDIQLEEGEEMTTVQLERLTDESINILLHELMTTTVETNAGEAYDAFFTFNTAEGYRSEKSNTRAKIVKAIVELLTPGKPEEYQQYVYKYFVANTYDLNISSIVEGKSIIAQATMFADVMRNRAHSLNYKDENGDQVLDLSNSRYDAEQLTKEDVILIRKAAGFGAAKQFREMMGDELVQRINGLDPNYLNYAIGVINAYLIQNEDQAETERSQKLMEFSLKVVPYLQFGGYQVRPAVGVQGIERKLPDIEKVIFDESLEASQINEHLGIYKQESKGVAAFYSLAVAFGYRGTPNIVSLQRFFTPQKKERYGVYWRKSDDYEPYGGIWVVNDRNGSDDECYGSHDEAALQVIEEFKNDNTDVFDNRNNYITNPGDRDYDIKQRYMAQSLGGIMQSAYNSSGLAQEEHLTTATEHFADTFFEEESYSSGVSALANDPTTGLRMAGEQAYEMAKDHLPLQQLKETSEDAYQVGVSVVEGVGSALGYAGDTISGWFSDDE